MNIKKLIAYSAILIMIVSFYVKSGSSVPFKMVVADHQIKCIENIMKYEGEILSIEPVEFPSYLEGYNIISAKLNDNSQSLQFNFGVCIATTERVVSLSDDRIFDLITDFKQRYGEDIFITHNPQKNEIKLHSKN